MSKGKKTGGRLKGIPVTEKNCTDCGKLFRGQRDVCLKCREKPCHRSAESIASSRQWRVNNPEKIAENSRKWRVANPDYLTSWHRKKQYGISPEQFAELLKTQRGCCAGCLRPFESNSEIGVDHDHDTGEIRGLLHRKCNTALGMVYDSPESLRHLAAYLESEHTGLRVRRAA